MAIADSQNAIGRTEHVVPVLASSINRFGAVQLNDHQQVNRWKYTLAKVRSLISAKGTASSQRAQNSRYAANSGRMPDRTSPFPVYALRSARFVTPKERAYCDI